MTGLFISSNLCISTVYLTTTKGILVLWSAVARGTDLRGPLAYSLLLLQKIRNRGLLLPHPIETFYMIDPDELVVSV